MMNINRRETGLKSAFCFVQKGYPRKYTHSIQNTSTKVYTLNVKCNGAKTPRTRTSSGWKEEFSFHEEKTSPTNYCSFEVPCLPGTACWEVVVALVRAAVSQPAFGRKDKRQSQVSWSWSKVTKQHPFRKVHKRRNLYLCPFFFDLSSTEDVGNWN